MPGTVISSLSVLFNSFNLHDILLFHFIGEETKTQNLSTSPQIIKLGTEGGSTQLRQSSCRIPVLNHDVIAHFRMWSEDIDHGVNRDVQNQTSTNRPLL